MSKRELAAPEALRIQPGDLVRTAFRGGVRQGPVIQREPPKMVFSRRRKGQPDKEVKHKPSTLEKVTDKTQEESPELKKSRASSSARKRSTKASGSKARASAGKRAGGKGKGREAAEPPSPKGGRVSKRQGAKAAPPSPKTPTKATTLKKTAGDGGSDGKRSGGGKRGGGGGSSRRATRSGTQRARSGSRRG